MKFQRGLKHEEILANYVEQLAHNGLRQGRLSNEARIVAAKRRQREPVARAEDGKDPLQSRWEGRSSFR